MAEVRKARALSNPVLLGAAAMLLLCLIGNSAHAEPTAPKPLIGVYITPKDIQTAKDNIARYSWAQDEWNRIKKVADSWLERDDEWIRKVIPPKGATYAYGVNGCPICGAAWKSFGKDLCSWDKPEKVICPSCKHEFPDADPKSPYYDPDRGIIVNGKEYYLKGVWNAWVVDQMSSSLTTSSALDNLGYAYALTGDERYAHKAMVIMDALATVAPTTIGPRDFQRNRESLEGRFHYLTSIVYRVRMNQLGTYDLIGQFSELSQPSPTNPGLTYAENIKKNLLEDYLFLHFDVRNMNLTTLHNHEGDSVRAMLGVGLVTGNPDYIRWGLESLFYFIDNTVDRDGQYYETSASYSQFSASVLCDMAELAANYSPNDYADPTKYPDTTKYPYHLNFFNHPKLARTCLSAKHDLDCAGHTPSFGNTHYDVSVVQSEDEKLDPGSWGIAERFYSYSTDPEIKASALNILNRASSGEPDSYRKGTWCLFHSKDLPEVKTTSTFPQKSTLLGGRVAGMLRAGEDPNRRAVFMRGGCTLPHGHDDQLGLLLSGKGRDLTYEIGYGIFGTHVNVGYSIRQVTHNVVIVDEDQNRPDGYFRVSPGAKVLLFDDQSPIRVMEMDGLAARSTDKLKMYRRAVAQVDISPEDSYVVDIFRVAGGSRHDYTFHAPYGADESNDFKTDQITMEKPEAWTVAGLNPINKGASYDKPGKSWGERITAGEFIEQLGDPNEKIGGHYWIAPPRNGYGFLHNVQVGKADTPWIAEWYGLDPNDTRLRLIGLPQPGTEVITSEGPTLDSKHRLHYMMARRSGQPGLESRFVSVIVPYQKSCFVEKIEEIELKPVNTMAVCLKVTLSDGRVDYILSAPEPNQQYNAVDGAIRITFQGQYGMVRTRNGKVENQSLFNGTRLSCNQNSVHLDKPSLSGKITGIDNNAKTITLDVPAGQQDLAGRVALIRTGDSPRNAAYTIQESKEDHGKLVLKLQSLDFVLAEGLLDKDSKGTSNESKVPVPYAYAYDNQTHYFDGCPIKNLRTGEVARASSFKTMQNFELEKACSWKAGDAFEILEFGVGDSVSIPLSVSK